MFANASWLDLCVAAIVAVVVALSGSIAPAAILIPYALMTYRNAPRHKELMRLIAEAQQQK